MKKKILFYVLHLLGTGHVHRVKHLVASLVEKKFDVTIIYGGKPMSINFATNNICYLPPISAKDFSFNEYIDEKGNIVTNSYLQKRQKILNEFFAKNKFDMIITETFPFGRKIVGNEILALLEQAKQQQPKPIIAASIRDIIEPHKKQKRYGEIKNIVNRYFDYIFIHSDKNIISLNKKYQLTNKLIYTGFVINSEKNKTAIKNYDIIVSCGGGAFGFNLLKTALEVAKLSSFNKLKWCLACGINMPKQQIAILKKSQSANVKIIANFSNLKQQLQNAKFSISQCGYNSAMDVLCAKNCKAIFVPFDIEQQQEQLLRAKLLADAGLAICLPHSKLTIAALEAALYEAKKLNKKNITNINFAGTKNCASFIAKILKN